MGRSMGRTEWQWNGAIPFSFFATLLLLGIIAVVSFVELGPGARSRLNWALVGLAIVVAAGALTIAMGTLFPVGVNVGDDGVRLAYLHRREFLAWPTILALEYRVDSTVTIETSLRSISLGVPGKAFVGTLVREMRRRKRRVRTPMPEEYPESEGVPPAF